MYFMLIALTLVFVTVVTVAVYYHGEVARCRGELAGVTSLVRMWRQIAETRHIETQELRDRLSASSLSEFHASRNLAMAATRPSPLPDEVWDAAGRGFLVEDTRPDDE